MGMYDYVNIRTECPHCRKVIEGFQSKDNECALRKLNLPEVNNFYMQCPHCKKWVEFTRRDSNAQYIPLNELLREFEVK